MIKKLASYYLRKKIPDVYGKIYLSEYSDTHVSMKEPYIFIINGKLENDILAIPKILQYLNLSYNNFIPISNLNLFDFSKIHNRFFNTTPIHILSNSFFIQKSLETLGCKFISNQDINSLSDSILSNNKNTILFTKHLNHIFNDENSLPKLIFNILFSGKENSYNFHFTNLTCDLLINEKINSFIHPPTPVSFFQKITIEKISSTLDELSNKMVSLTPGNLFVFALFSNNLKEGIPRHFLFYKMNILANLLHKHKIINVSIACLTKSYDDLFSEMLFNAGNNEYIRLTPSKMYKSTEKLNQLLSTTNPKLESNHQSNNYLSHYKQILPYKKVMDKIWNEIDFYD